MQFPLSLILSLLNAIVWLKPKTQNYSPMESAYATTARNLILDDSKKKNGYPGVKILAALEGTTDIWYWIGKVGTQTHYEAIGGFKSDRAPTPLTLLVAKSHLRPHPAWVELTCIRAPGFRVYRSPDVVSGCDD